MSNCPGFKLTDYGIEMIANEHVYLIESDHPPHNFKVSLIRKALKDEGPCAVCGRLAPLVDTECPNCRH